MSTALCSNSGRTTAHDINSMASALGNGLRFPFTFPRLQHGDVGGRGIQGGGGQKLGTLSFTRRAASFCNDDSYGCAGVISFDL